MATLYYFAYGSNMSTPRLRQRVPSARFITTARLEKHRLVFHKKSGDGSAKCDAACTGVENDIVYGVIFQFEVAEKPVLDKHEALGKGYGEKSVSVCTEDGHVIEAYTYYATRIDASMKPYDWYKEHVIRGATEYGLSEEYIDSITAIEAIADPDVQRYERELAIYRK